MPKTEITYRCNGCETIFTISIIGSTSIPQDGFYACCPCCGKTGWRALEEIDNVINCQCAV